MPAIFGGTDFPEKLSFLGANQKAIGVRFGSPAYVLETPANNLRVQQNPHLRNLQKPYRQRHNNEQRFPRSVLPVPGFCD